MKEQALCLAAVDLGAESGRVMLARYDGRSLTLEEAHRFANIPVRIGNALYWDVLRLFGDIKHGLVQAQKRANGQLAGIGIDTWGVDYALLDAKDRLLDNPHHYRDPRSNQIGDYAFARMPWAQIFARTGIQFLQFNTLFQLAAMQRDAEPTLEHARRLLMIPDLLNFWLCGIKANEFTNATTTQCINALTRRWDSEILAAFGLRGTLFGDIVEPCSVLGPLTGELGEAIGATPVIAVASHDTGSAVLGAPLTGTEPALYISSGTWSLMGFESHKPVINDTALTYNVTNEGGAGGTVRVLKNIMGLWLLQECRRSWAKAGRSYSYAELEHMAANAQTHTRIAVDDARFLPPDDMPARIRAYCIETGQEPPSDDGEMARCVLESLAQAYAESALKFDDLASVRHGTIHVIGGGSQNTLLNTLTAQATGRTVLPGPVEATALGNVIAQLIALGEVRSMAQGRQLVAG